MILNICVGGKCKIPFTFNSDIYAGAATYLVYTGGNFQRWSALGLTEYNISPFVCSGKLNKYFRILE